MDGWVDGSIIGWMGEWMDGWIIVWMGEWMDRRDKANIKVWNPLYIVNLCNFFNPTFQILLKTWYSILLAMVLVWWYGMFYIVELSSMILHLETKTSLPTVSLWGDPFISNTDFGKKHASTINREEKDTKFIS